MSNTDSKLEQLLQYNRDVAKTYETPPTMVQFRAQAAANGGGGLVVGTYPHM